MIKYLVFLGMSSCEQRNRQQMVRNMYSLGPMQTQNQPQRGSLSVSRVILEAIYALDEVWGRD